MNNLVRVTWAVTLTLWILTATSVWADGAGELEPFPITGRYQAAHRGDLGRVAVIDVVGNYDRTLDSGEDQVEPRAVVAREFFRTHPDRYDFLVVFSTFEYDTGEALALHWGVQNQVQGIGIEAFDVSALFGSGGRLLGYIDMGALSRHETAPIEPAFENTLTALGHEVMHQWSGRARFVDADGQVSTALLGKDGSHWSDLLDSDASVLYGHKWLDNQNGTFTSEAILRFFSPLDLYLAGFYQPSEVPPFTLIESPDHQSNVVPQPGITIEGRATTITIEDVIAAEGPRIPAAEDAHKQFHFAFILLTRPGETVKAEYLTAVEHVSTQFAERFAVWTGGRAIAHTGLAAPVTVTAGAPEGIESDAGVRDDPATLDTALRDALAWLKSQQQQDGAWQDKPATAMRDTVVVMDALLPLASDFVGREQAVRWLLDQSVQSTDYQARQARALGVAQTLLATDFLAQYQDDFERFTVTQLGGLVAQQHEDGGWGLAASYASDSLDTALVLKAFHSIEYIEGLRAGSQVRSAALQYLADSQQPDGGWPVVANGPSRLHVTTHVLAALQLYDPEHQSVEAALHWLAGRQHADGGFGDASSTVHETAQALRTFIAFQAMASIQSVAAVDYLLVQQQDVGSWASSTYATALAIDALRRFQLPNWRLGSLQVTRLGAPSDAPANAPVHGEWVAITVTVYNDGSASTPEGVVRLFDGEPTNGGQVIGVDLIVPSLEPGAGTSLQASWDTLRGEPGAHILAAVVDPDEHVIEANEQDNRATQGIDVAPAPDGTELIVTSLHVTPARPVALPTTLGLSAIVRNAGTVDAERARVQLWAGDIDQGQLVGESVHRIGSRQSTVVNFTYPLAQPGITVLTVVADADHAVVEANEANNAASVTVETTPSVDLYVDASDIENVPAPGVAGSDITFTVHLHNAGTQLSPPTEIRYELVDGQGVTELGRQTVEIAAGSRLTRTLTWRADQSGDLMLIVHLDPDNLVPETEEQNNIANFPFQVDEVDGPNLVVDFQDLSMVPDPGLEGQDVTISAWVRNTGSQDASDVAVAFYHGDPDQGGPLIGTLTTFFFAVKSSVPVSVIWPQLPSADAQLVVVRVDPDNAIAEFSETDNTAFREFDIMSLPDLAIDAAGLQLTPGFPVGGETVTLQARVTNLGDQPVADAVVRTFVGHIGGPQVGGDQHLSVAGHDTALAAFVWTLSEADAVHTLVLQVDPDNMIAESSEQNNTAQKHVAVQDRDFFVRNPYFSPNGDGILDDTTFFFRTSQDHVAQVVVVDETNTVMRQFVLSDPDRITHGQVDWDGLDHLGRVVRDGVYRFELRGPTAETLGDAVVVVDNNRSPLAEAVGTPFGMHTNWTCQLGHVRDVVFADDDDMPFVLASASDTLTQGLYYGRDLQPIVQLFNDDMIESGQVASDGSTIAYIWRDDQGQRQLVVMHRDGTQRQTVPLDEDPIAVLAVVVELGDVIVNVQAKNDGQRNQVLAVPLTGAAPRVLYQVPNDNEQILFHGVSADQKQLFIGTRSTVELIDMASGAVQSVYADTSAFSIVEGVMWSPDGEKIAIKIFHEDNQGIGQYQILIASGRGDLLGAIQAELTGDSNRCIYLASHNMAWSPASDRLAFDLAKGIAECLTNCFAWLTWTYTKPGERAGQSLIVIRRYYNLVGAINSAGSAIKTFYFINWPITTFTRFRLIRLCRLR